MVPILGRMDYVVAFSTSRQHQYCDVVVGLRGLLYICCRCGQRYSRADNGAKDSTWGYANARKESGGKNGEVVITMTRDGTKDMHDEP